MLDDDLPHSLLVVVFPNPIFGDITMRPSILGSIGIGLAYTAATAAWLVHAAVGFANQAPAAEMSHWGLLLPCIAVVGDVFKVLAGLAIYAAFRDRRLVLMLVGLSIWLPTTFYSARSAFEFTSTQQADVRATRELRSKVTKNLTSQLEREERTLAWALAQEVRTKTMRILQAGDVAAGRRSLENLRKEAQAGRAMGGVDPMAEQLKSWMKPETLALMNVVAIVAVLELSSNFGFVTVKAFGSQATKPRRRSQRGEHCLGKWRRKLVQRAKLVFAWGKTRRGTDAAERGLCDAPPIGTVQSGMVAAQPTELTKGHAKAPTADEAFAMFSRDLRGTFPFKRLRGKFEDMCAELGTPPVHPTRLSKLLAEAGFKKWLRNGRTMYRRS